MSRIIFKGGPWSNKEDALLQAALAKYGMQNWDRVASMLENRKTPQQCKDRWFMYLDPSVNKGEWTGDEEEKLVELQEAFPGQWELIAAQIKGRRAWQCEAHYHALVEASGGGKGVAPDAMIADLRNRRMQQSGGGGGGANLFDMAYETRAPRADAVDNDSKDEEMLATATARLGNQDGKKQSRDARKQQLKETSFLTTLQRGREMEESGTMSERLKQRRQRALNDDEVGDDNGDATADGFAPIEVLQSAARHKKKDKLYVQTRQRNEQGTAVDDEGSTGGVDITALFAPGTVAPLITQAGSSTSLLDWGAAGLGGLDERIDDRNHRPANYVKGPLAVPQATPQALAHDNGQTVSDDDDDTVSGANSVSITQSAWEAAARLIEAEANLGMVPTAACVARGEMQRAERLIHQAGGQSAHAANNHPPPSMIDVTELRNVLCDGAAVTKRTRGRDASSDLESEVDRLRQDVQRELARGVQLRGALHFYRSVCVPAEAAAMAKRVEDAEMAVAEKRQHERHLQDDFRRRHSSAATAFV